MLQYKWDYYLMQIVYYIWWQALCCLKLPNFSHAAWAKHPVGGDKTWVTFNQEHMSGMERWCM